MQEQTTTTPLTISISPPPSTSPLPSPSNAPQLYLPTPISLPHTFALPPLLKNLPPPPPSTQSLVIAPLPLGAPRQRFTALTPSGPRTKIPIPPPLALVPVPPPITDLYEDIPVPSIAPSILPLLPTTQPAQSPSPVSVASPLPWQTSNASLDMSLWSGDKPITRPPQNIFTLTQVNFFKGKKNFIAEIVTTLSKPQISHTDRLSALNMLIELSQIINNVELYSNAEDIVKWFFISLSFCVFTSL